MTKNDNQIQKLVIHVVFFILGYHAVLH